MMKLSNSGGSSSSSTNNTSCQDCGNKAKRDCAHKRCRTCCKSRGFQCSTHVKSTWVPVARRRLKLLQQQHYLSNSNTLDHHLLPLPLSLSNVHYCSQGHTSTTGQEGMNFPAEVNSLATFRCIRVSSEDNLVDQYAYQTSVTIRGHVFKGILYNQGSTTAANRGGGDSSSAATVTSGNHQFNLMTIPTTTATAATQPSEGGGANIVHHHPSLYCYHNYYNNAYLPGMQFFPHPRP